MQALCTSTCYSTDILRYNNNTLDDTLQVVVSLVETMSRLIKSELMVLGVKEKLRVQCGALLRLFFTAALKHLKGSALVLIRQISPQRNLFLSFPLSSFRVGEKVDIKCKKHFKRHQEHKHGNQSKKKHDHPPPSHTTKRYVTK